ncbi:MAG: urease accessory protein UreD [Pseudomonadota bacterium]
MYDGALQTMQRADGAATVRFAGAGADTRLADLAQRGAAKAMLPRTHTCVPEVVFLNTAGGLTGGDRLTYTLDLPDGGMATAATQTAERIYDAGGGVARMDVSLSLGDGARLDWLPQETILFDSCALERETTVTLGADATYLGIETLVLGRKAMGEVVRSVSLKDRRRVLRGGVPVVIEPLALEADALAGDGPAVLGGATVQSTLLFVGPGAEDAIGPVRAVLDESGVRAAASAWNGRLVVRLLGADSWPVRRVAARILTVLRKDPLPRVWQL